MSLTSEKLKAIVEHLFPKIKNSIQNEAKSTRKEQQAQVIPIKPKPQVIFKKKEQESDSQISSDDIEEGLKLFDQMSIESQQQSNNIQQNKEPLIRKEKQIQQQDIQEEPIIKGILKKQKVNNNNKKVSFVQDMKNMSSVQVLSFHPQRRWDQVLNRQRKGKFTMEQYQILIKSIDTFARVNNMDLQQLIQILSGENEESKSERTKKIWTNICSVLQNRSLTSTFKFLKRMLHTNNHLGKWTKQDEEKLIILIEKHGRHWKKIAKQLNRTPENIRDKFRQLGQENFQKIQSFWSIEQLVIYLKGLQKYSDVQFLNLDIQLQLEHSQKHNQIERKQLRTKTYNSKNFVFHNLQTVSKYINPKKFDEIDSLQIDWAKLSNKLGTKSIMQCKNKFIQLLSINFKLKSSVYTDEQILIFIRKQRVERQIDINWKLWKNQQISSTQAINRWKILKKHVEGRKSKALKDILKQLNTLIQNRKKIQQ